MSSFIKSERLFYFLVDQRLMEQLRLQKTFKSIASVNPALPSPVQKHHITLFELLQGKVFLQDSGSQQAYIPLPAPSLTGVSAMPLQAGLRTRSLHELFAQVMNSWQFLPSFGRKGECITLVPHEL